MTRLFDPCSLPPEAIYAAGADPETARRHNICGPPRDRWRICTWEGDWFLLTVYVTAHTMAELAKVTVNHAFTRTALPGREGACTYIECDYGPNAIGDLSFPFAAGVIIIRVATRRDALPPESPLVTAGRIAKILNRHLPL
jgi:hypothetical protein